MSTRSSDSFISTLAEIKTTENLATMLEVRQLQDQIFELKEEIENMRKFFLWDKNNEGSKNDSI